MEFLIDQLLKSEEYQKALQAIKSGKTSIDVDGCKGSGKTHIAHSICSI